MYFFNTFISRLSQNENDLLSALSVSKFYTCFTELSIDGVVQKSKINDNLFGIASVNQCNVVVEKLSLIVLGSKTEKAINLKIFSHILFEIQNIIFDCSNGKYCFLHTIFKVFTRQIQKKKCVFPLLTSRKRPFQAVNIFFKQFSQRLILKIVFRKIYIPENAILR